MAIREGLSFGYQVDLTSAGTDDAKSVGHCRMAGSYGHMLSNNEIDDIFSSKLYHCTLATLNMGPGQTMWHDLRTPALSADDVRNVIHRREYLYLFDAISYEDDRGQHRTDICRFYTGPTGGPDHICNVHDGPQ
jgi:hypothetical protein